MKMFILGDEFCDFSVREFYFSYKSLFITRIIFCVQKIIKERDLAYPLGNPSYIHPIFMNFFYGLPISPKNRIFTFRPKSDSVSWVSRCHRLTRLGTGECRNGIDSDFDSENLKNETSTPISAPKFPSLWSFEKPHFTFSSFYMIFHFFLQQSLFFLRWSNYPANWAIN